PIYITMLSLEVGHQIPCKWFFVFDISVKNFLPLFVSATLSFFSSYMILDRDCSLYNPLLTIILSSTT
ncbi:MAG: hypothetical protein ACPLPP_06855, partial [Caldisericum exile]